MANLASHFEGCAQITQLVSTNIRLCEISSGDEANKICVGEQTDW